MKESRIIIIILIIFAIVLTVLAIIFEWINPIKTTSFNIITNLYCGIIVGLITSICQYFNSKKRIINTVYSIYFDLYRTYYYSKSKEFFWHYNVISIYRKIMELSPKINETLDDYHGFFRKKNRIYKKLNPKITIGKEYKAKTIIRSFFWFNKKPFKEIIESFMIEVENILININKERFYNDKVEMQKMFDYVWSSNKIETNV